jgi:3',5'-cyclic AMP phosphodiesterase CpdA
MSIIPFAAVSCSHCPFEDEESVGWAVKTLETLKPRPRRIIFDGDLFDATPASVHPMKDEHTLELEYKHAASLLSRLRAAVPYRCEYIWMLGNHDDNIQRPDHRRVPRRLRSLVHWNKSQYKDEFLRWRQMPYVKSPAGCYSIGQVTFTHGFDCTVYSDELEALQFAWMLGGFHNRLVVRGHTHRPVPVTQCYRTRNVPLAYYFANVGTLGPRQPLYMSRKSAYAWGPALLYGEAVLHPRYNQADPQWSAELLTPETLT